jgi:hypothetical protein
MKTTIKRARTTHLTMKFTPAQVREIEKAAKASGWRPGEGGIYARRVVLQVSAAILRT